MTFKPKGNRVVVRRRKADDKTKGGIVIPDTAKTQYTEGEALAVGPGCTNVRTGDRVFFNAYGWYELREELAGPDAVVVKEHDILWTWEV